MSAFYTVSCPCCFAHVYNIHLDAHLEVAHSQNDGTHDYRQEQK